MPKDETDKEALRRALNFDWPEIQKHLIEEAAKRDGQERAPYEPYWTTNSDGTRTLHASADAWWLKDFHRNDVLMELPGLVIMNTKPWHCADVAYVFRETYGILEHEDCDDCFTQEDIQTHIERFPQGQFMAMRISGPGAGHAIAMAVTLRTSRPPGAPILPWMEAIGDLQISAHEANGDWLYGVEMAVRPMYRRHGIGSALYETRFDLARRLNLRGWYAIGMLMGYRKLAVDALRGAQKAALDEVFAAMRNNDADFETIQAARDKLKDFPTYADLMDVVEYGEKVIKREMKDPTVTMQMNRGFRAERVITDYVDEPAAGNAGVLIVWDNPDYEQDG